MSAQECSHVWSEVLITAKAFRRTVPPGSHGSASKYGPARLKFIRRVGHLENDPLISSCRAGRHSRLPQDQRRSENLGCCTFADEFPSYAHRIQQALAPLVSKCERFEKNAESITPLVQGSKRANEVTVEEPRRTGRVFWFEASDRYSVS